MNQKFIYTESFNLESGKVLPEIQIQYTTYGVFNPGKSKVIWVCHALTANSEVFDWWPGLFGEECLFNSKDYFIICANILGSCYGTTGPLSINPETSHPYFHTFPEITIRDMVNAHRVLAKSLGIEKIDFLMGGSLGGMQAMEWAIIDPNRIQRICLIATNAKHSAWGIAFNESQRMAIRTDSSWTEDSPEAGLEGMKTARSIALLTYRNYRTYESKQSNEEMDIIPEFKASSYQNYQGLKLAKRFNAFSYWSLSKTMDSHNIGRNRGGLKRALQEIKCPSLIIGISSDFLFPIQEQEFLYKNITQSEFAVMDSLYGHDGFLIETPTLTQIISNYLNKI